MEKIPKVCETRWVWIDVTGVLEDEGRWKRRLWRNKASVSTAHYIWLYASVDQYQLSLTAESFFFHFLSAAWPNSVHRNFPHPFCIAFFHHHSQTWEPHVKQLRKAMSSRVQARDIESRCCCLLSFWGSKEHFPSSSLLSLYLQFAQPFREALLPDEEPSSGIQWEYLVAVLLLSGCRF